MNFMQIAGAFDNVSFDAINRSTENLGFTSKVTCCMKYMEILLLNLRAMSRKQRGVNHKGVISHPRCG